MDGTPDLTETSALGRLRPIERKIQAVAAQQAVAADDPVELNAGE